MCHSVRVGIFGGQSGVGTRFSLPLRFQAVCTFRPTTRTLILSTSSVVQSDTKKRELLKNLTKIEEIQEKKFIDRN